MKNRIYIVAFAPNDFDYYDQMYVCDSRTNMAVGLTSELENASRMTLQRALAMSAMVYASEAAFEPRLYQIIENGDSDKP